MKKKEHDSFRDFVTLFSHLWYDRFPVDCSYHPTCAHRADWTRHIDRVINACADLEGWIVGFESEKRTDACYFRPTPVGKDLELVAALEWEWNLISAFPKEIESLNGKSLSKDGFCCYIGYEIAGAMQQSIDWCCDVWTNERPLLAILIECDRDANRSFDRMHFFRVEKGKAEHLFEQPALRWKVEGTRWYVPSA